ncbi:MAG: PD-(D/E)XK nuclease family protein [Planctomycetaceae bacterium]
MALGDVDPEKIPEIFVHHERPAIPETTTAAETRLPLSKFRDAVRDAGRQPPPRLLETAPATPKGAVHLSVSEILAADRLLREGSSPARGRETTGDGDDVGVDNIDRSLLGTVIHGMIERIGEQPAERILETVLRDHGDVGDEIRDAAIRRVRLFLDSPVFAEIASSDPCLREVDFLLPKSVAAGPQERELSAIISGQIDCLYRTGDDRWHLVDFKTGRQHADDPPALIDAYAVQLGLYAQAAAPLLGRPPDEVAIVQIGDAVRRLTVPPGEHASQSMDARIAAAIRHAVDA